MLEKVILKPSNPPTLCSWCGKEIVTHGKEKEVYLYNGEYVCIFCQVDSLTDELKRSDLQHGIL